MTSESPFGRAHRAALDWIITAPEGAGLAPAEWEQFADSYAAMIDDLPADRYPDTPPPSPEDFASENGLTPEK